jgi:hypothetical protein
MLILSTACNNLCAQNQFNGRRVRLTFLPPRLIVGANLQPDESLRTSRPTAKHTGDRRRRVQ